MEVRLFGELEAVEAGVPVPVRGAKQRALLALLALLARRAQELDLLSRTPQPATLTRRSRTPGPEQATPADHPASAQPQPR
jgi:hypothetical protein